MCQRYVILAPHVDDEVIGCFSLLDKNLVDEVYYFFEVDKTREAEAIQSGKRFDFTPVFMKFDGVIRPKDLADRIGERIVLAPNIRDAHPHHKQVNLIAKQLPQTKNYYSVDMNTRFRVLDEKERTDKKHALHTLFQSQARVLSNEKYHLFESIQPSDYSSVIEVSTQFQGIHSYPNAPEEVSYLRYPHRHVFHVKVRLEVLHDDREVEFIMFKIEIEKFIQENLEQLNNKSCEMIASQILTHVINSYPERDCSVSVSEDGENGATLSFNYSGALS